MRRGPREALIARLGGGRFSFQVSRVLPPRDPDAPGAPPDPQVDENGNPVVYKKAKLGQANKMYYNEEVRRPKVLPC